MDKKDSLGTNSQGVLSVVATPIGNLEDITLRAIRVLSEADVIYCEDTRVTKKLLTRHGIETPVRRLDAHLEKNRAKEVIEELMIGKHIAYVTDAGTPGISDPGARLVRLVHEALSNSATIEAVPGPSAVSTALSVAGFSADQFVFFGFLPHKKGRKTLLKEISNEPRTMVLFESPHRIMKLLYELGESIGVREVTVLRELTKKFEEIQRGDPKGIAEYLEEYGVVKGEFVVVIAPGR